MVEDLRQTMASVVISSRGGQLGGDTGQTYYCFDCDRTLTITASSDSGIICPICGHVVLEEFETPSPSSSPSLPPQPPPPPLRSTTFIDPQSFFPTSDTDSDVELSDSLPLPPPPPFFTTSSTSTRVGTTLDETIHYLSPLQILPPPPSRSNWDFYCPFDGELRGLRPPTPPPPPPPPRIPLVSVIGHPQFPLLPSAPALDNFFHSPSEENDATQHSHFDFESDPVRPPLPPLPPPEDLLRSPPLSPASSSDVSVSFYSPIESEEDTPNQQMRSPNPLPQLPASNYWDYFFPSFPETELNSPNHQITSQLQPPTPPPWLQAPPMEEEEELLDMKMTKELVSEWECHQCSICIDNFELNQKVKLTPCNHLYHSNCLLRWLDLHKSCPVCRCKL